MAEGYTFYNHSENVRVLRRPLRHAFLAHPDMITYRSLTHTSLSVARIAHRESVLSPADAASVLPDTDPDIGNDGLRLLRA